MVGRAQSLCEALEKTTHEAGEQLRVSTVEATGAPAWRARLPLAQACAPAHPRERRSCRYAPRPPVTHKLDPYKGIIDTRLKAFPKLSAKRLFDEVCAAGYPGCYESVRDYVRATRPRESGEAPVPRG